MNPRSQRSRELGREAGEEGGSKERRDRFLTLIGRDFERQPMCIHGLARALEHDGVAGGERELRRGGMRRLVDKDLT